MVKFTANEKRILGLPQDFNENHLPEAIALRKIIDTFPFILEASDHGFDPVISKIILHREAAIVELRQNAENAINERVGQLSPIQPPKTEVNP